MTPTAKTRDGVLRGGSGLAIRMLILAAAVISAYLLSVSLSGGRAVGCAPGSSCDAVLQSRWAYIFGIPVTVFAFLVDFTLLLATYASGPRARPPQRRKAWEIIVPCAVLVIGAALWFTAVQAVVLKQFCPWCMAAHLCGTVGAVLLLIRVPVREKVDRPEKDPSLTRRSAVKLAAIAMVMIAAVGVAQIIVAPKTYTVTAIPSAGSNAAFMLASNGAVAGPIQVSTTNPTAVTPVQDTAIKPEARQSGSSALPASGSGSQFAVYGGAVMLDLSQVPLWGSPNAPHKMVSLYDYTCHHCAEMHSRVTEVFREFSNQLAVINLPMPLDGQCNPMIRRTPPAHQGACNYARAGLAVWRLNPDALKTYEHWYFERYHQVNAGPVRSGYQAPPWSEVTNHAAQLVGGAVALENAMRDPRIEELINKSVAIHSTSMRKLNNGSMPQFIIGTNLVSGTLETAKLRELVAKYVEGR